MTIVIGNSHKAVTRRFTIIMLSAIAALFGFQHRGAFLYALPYTLLTCFAALYVIYSLKKKPLKDDAPVRFREVIAYLLLKWWWYSTCLLPFLLILSCMDGPGERIEEYRSHDDGYGGGYWHTSTEPGAPGWNGRHAIQHTLQIGSTAMVAPFVVYFIVYIRTDGAIERW